MEENKGFILERMTFQLSKSVYLLDVNLFSTQNAMVPQSSQCFSLCTVKGGHEHVVQNVK